MSLRIRSRLATLKFIFRNRRHFSDFILAMERDRIMIWRHSDQWYAPDIQKTKAMWRTTQLVTFQIPAASLQGSL